MSTDRNIEKLLLDYDLHCKRIAKSTSININETPSAKQARIKWLESDYNRWFEYYCNTYAKAPCADFHKEFADDVESNNEIYMLFEVYRSGAKSVHADIGAPLYLMVKGKLHFMLLVGETADKSKKLLSGIQAQLKYNQRFINDYGRKFKHGDWSDGDFVTVDGIRFTSLGFGQNPRGIREEEQRPDYIVVDDVDNKKHVNNDSLMSDGVDFITEDIWGCYDEADGATKRFVYCNNNFHKNSITNRLERLFKTFIQKARDEGRKAVHKIIKIKAVSDLHSFTPAWPSKTSAEYWKKKFENTPYRSFMREYMHVHIEDGTVFKIEDMQWKKMLPYKDYEALSLYGDLSYKDTACHKGLFLVGKTGREFHIIHSFLRQTSRAKAAKWLYDLYEDHDLKKVPKIRYYIEGLFSMDEFVNDFDNEGDDRGYYIPVIADKKTKIDKFDRIEATQAFYERRNVFFNIDEKDNADQIELVDQYLAFEKGSGSPVDGPDAVEGAFSKLNGVTRKAKGTWKFGQRESRKF
jgi:predicted phage terminase large subunit-like protein